MRYMIWFVTIRNVRITTSKQFELILKHKEIPNTYQSFVIEWYKCLQTALFEYIMSMNYTTDSHAHAYFAFIVER